MKQLWVSIFLLAALLAGGLLTSWGARQVQEPIALQLEQASQAGFREDWEQAEALCAAARTRWETYRNALAAIADHGPMEEIDSLFGELEVYRQAKDPALFSGLCTRLSMKARSIWESLSLSWWNLL